MLSGCAWKRSTAGNSTIPGQPTSRLGAQLLELLPNLRERGLEGREPSPMLLDNLRWRALREGRFAQLRSCLDDLSFEPHSFLFEPFALEGGIDFLVQHDARGSQNGDRGS